MPTHPSDMLTCRSKKAYGEDSVVHAFLSSQISLCQINLLARTYHGQTHFGVGILYNWQTYHITLDSDVMMCLYTGQGVMNVTCWL